MASVRRTLINAINRTSDSDGQELSHAVSCQFPNIGDTEFQAIAATMRNEFEESRYHIWAFANAKMIALNWSQQS